MESSKPATDTQDVVSENKPKVEQNSGTEPKQDATTSKVVTNKQEEKKATIQDLYENPLNKQLLDDKGLLEGKSQISQMLNDATRPRPFWDTQPVPKLIQTLAKPNIQEDGPIEQKTFQEVRKEPYKLPGEFEWVDVNLENEDELSAVYKLLTENYVQDDDNMFRFDYSKEFLQWALLVPNYYKDWIVGVRMSKNQQLMGFITGVPVHLMVNQVEIQMTEINFLCVHKSLRTKRLAPVLIQEITRRVNIKNMWQAVYTAGVVVPTPISKARYYHRNMNPKKLIEVGFSALGPNQTISRLTQLNKLPEETSTKGLRVMVKKDAPQVKVLLNKYLEQFTIFPQFNEMEILHFFVPRPLVMYSYVVSNDKGEITDFISYYHLPSSVLKNPKHKDLKAVYSFYNVATTVPLKSLIQDALILAHKEGFDVFNALDIMDNEEFLKDLIFCPGDGNLHYYLYNYRLTNFLHAKDLGLVLV